MSVFGNSGLKNARHPGFTSQPMGNNSKKPREDFEVVLRKKREFESVECRYLCFKTRALMRRFFLVFDVALYGRLWRAVSSILYLTLLIMDPVGPRTVLNSSRIQISKPLQQPRRLIKLRTKLLPQNPTSLLHRLRHP